MAVLARNDLLAPRFRTVALSYIGPESTAAIYRRGTIGAAKQHLERYAAPAEGLEQAVEVGKRLGRVVRDVVQTYAARKRLYGVVDFQDLVVLCRDLLRDRFREDVSPSDLGREVGIHPVHLASVFRKYLGCSVGEFVRNCRVEFAASRLACRGVPLADIAAEAGFADQSHFTRLFKRATGLTPAAFRRSIADD